MNIECPGFTDSVADRVLAVLTERQYVSPHRPVGEVLAASAGSIGFDRPCLQNALRRRGIDAATRIGRLRRTDLTLLAHAIVQLALSPRTEPDFALGTA